jgi:hypothetical protein
LREILYFPLIKRACEKLSSMKISTFFLFILLSVASHCFAADYSDYEQILSQRWALPEATTQDCQSHNPQVWINKANEMISLDPVTSKVALNDDEVMVLRNLLISQAYNRLFVQSLKIQETERPDIKFIWIAAGSQASVTVGHALQAGLAKKYPYGSRQRFVFENLEALHSDVPTIPKILLKTIAETKRKTAENNWRVFADIYWQHLAYMGCGYNEVVTLNKNIITQLRKDKQYSEINHYDRFIEVWKDMEKGRYVEANKKLIYIEQHNILQRYMYKGLDAQLANAMLLFNSMAKADLSGPGGRPIRSFTSFSLDNGDYPNLSNFPVRFRWMKYVVGEQAAFLKELATMTDIQAVLKKSLHESSQLVDDYLKYLN